MRTPARRYREPLTASFAGGVVVSDVSGGSDGAVNRFAALAIDSDGRIVASGFFYNMSNGAIPDKVILARYWP